MVTAANDPAEAPTQPQSAPLWNEDRFQRLVRQAARRKGITLTEAARLAGTSHNWLTQPATTTGRGIEKVLQIAKVLGIDPAELFSGSVRPPDREIGKGMHLLATISTVTAHLVAGLQLVDGKQADRIFLGVYRALIQILKEIEEGDDGKGK